MQIQEKFTTGYAFNWNFRGNDAKECSDMLLLRNPKRDYPQILGVFMTKRAMRAIPLTLEHDYLGEFHPLVY
jgi:hypothetical protein